MNDEKYKDKRELIFKPVPYGGGSTLYSPFFNGVELPFVQSVVVNTTYGEPATVTVTFVVVPIVTNEQATITVKEISGGRVER